MVKLTECPRDAMQGLRDYIPTKTKAEYINLLLGVGFDTIDFGSFVSPKAVPQMKDTEEVLQMLDLDGTNSKLLAIVANIKGMEQAIKHNQISYLGFPFSISETFQQRNTNSGIDQSFETVSRLLEFCGKSNKEAVVYLSMAFGNPYGDEWNNEIAEQWTDKLVKAGVSIISLSDTTGVSTPESIYYLFPHLKSQFPGVEFGLHLHSTPEQTEKKLEAAFNSGCRRFDSALRGYGGCPMATNSLTGNVATEALISLLNAREENTNLDYAKWEEAILYSSRIFK